MKFTFKEIVTLETALMTMGIVPVHFSKKRKLAPNDDRCLDKLITNFIDMKNKMLANEQCINDYNFVEREKKLSIEALKMCITEEVGFYKNM